MFENDFCEYVAARKKEGSYLGKIIAFSVALAVICIVSVIFIIPKSGAIGVLVLGGAFVLAWYLSRFTAIEYEYSVSGEYMDFAAVYAKQYRKELLSLELKKCAKKVMPYDGSFGDFKPSKVLDYRSSTKRECAYVLVFEENEQTKAVLFDGTKKVVENMFRQIPSLVVRSSDLP